MGSTLSLVGSSGLSILILAILFMGGLKPTKPRGSVMGARGLALGMQGDSSTIEPCWIMLGFDLA